MNLTSITALRALHVALLLAVPVANALAGPEETLSPIIAVPAGKIAIDGDLADWDFTGSQTAYVGAEFLEKEHGEFVFSYDKEFLYLAARVADTSPMRNIHHAVERYWEGDCIGIRLFTDLKNNGHVPTRTLKDKNPNVVHMMFFRQHTTGAVWKHFSYGSEFYESRVNPGGVEAAFREFPDHAGYAFEARVPWQALHVPAPPDPGESMRSMVQFDFGNQAGDRRIRQNH